jgi:predicted transport protein
MADKIADAMQTMVKNLEEKTGKKLDEWTTIARKSGFAKHGEIVKFLKAEHGLGHGYANMVAHAMATPKVLKTGEGDAEDLLTAQYAGTKAGLKPIYDKILKAVQAFGSDVEVSPKKTYVSLRRSKQFALVQPTTATRMDVGINLKGEKPTGRLEASGSFNSMVSHRVRIEDIKQVDAELLGWLKKAYQSA